VFSHIPARQDIGSLLRFNKIGFFAVPGFRTHPVTTTFASETKFNKVKKYDANPERTKPSYSY